jgi:CspA family cold shock protein
MSPVTTLIISIVIATIAATLTSVLLSGELIDWRLLVAFTIATISTAMIVGSGRDSRQSSVARTAPRTLSGDANRDHGTVKWFNASKGFGFIVKDDGEEIFVHFRSIRGEGRRGLRDGQRVSFVVAQSDKGPQAEDVAPAD